MELTRITFVTLQLEDSVQEPNIQVIYAACGLLCALAGAVYDVVSRRIPNGLTLPAMLFGLVVHASLGGWRGLGSAVAGGLLCGLIFLLFYIAGGMGGGDVKLVTAMGCHVGLSLTGTLLIATSLAGGLMAILGALEQRKLKQTVRNVGALAAHHATAGLSPHPDLHLGNQQSLRLPYAVAIAAGSAATLVRVVMQR
jgi:prepilin peptidase CpaA